MKYELGLPYKTVHWELESNSVLKWNGIQSKNGRHAEHLVFSLCLSAKIEKVNYSQRCTHCLKWILLAVIFRAKKTNLFCYDRISLFFLKFAQKLPDNKKRISEKKKNLKRIQIKSFLHIDNTQTYMLIRMKNGRAYSWE